MGKRKWEPERGEIYWRLSLGWGSRLGLDDIIALRWTGDIKDSGNWQIGNCFRTHKEAQAVAKKIKKLLKEESK